MSNLDFLLNEMGKFAFTLPFAVAALLAGSALMAAGQTDMPPAPPSGRGTVAPASPALDVTIAEIVARPRDYAGREVSVASTVEDIFSPWAIRLHEKRSIAGGIGADLLVLGVEPLAGLGFDRSWLHRKISVTGTIRMLRLSDFRHEYGNRIDDQLLRRYDGKPALIVSAMRLLR
ncbi:MAG TPA: hypothetical protein VJ652_07035 [Noviherbaspirillum sp.]|nr:hypothetical protein [Noviherbaspirillum sp.]